MASFGEVQHLFADEDSAMPPMPAGGPDALLLLAAAGGPPAAMRRCAEWGARNFNEALTVAAKNGRLQNLRQALTLRQKHWPAPHPFATAIWNAAANGHRACLRALRDASRYLEVDYNDALEYAAGGGHLGIMGLCVAWGATRLDRALRAAACQGKIEAVELCAKMGATTFGDAMGAAAMQGHAEVAVRCMQLGRELAAKGPAWVAGYVAEALYGATEHDQPQSVMALMENAREEEMEYDSCEIAACAARNGSIETLAKIFYLPYYSSDFDEFVVGRYNLHANECMAEAAWGNHPELACRLKVLGATNYEEAREYARMKGNQELEAQLTAWIAEAAAAAAP